MLRVLKVQAGVIAREQLIDLGLTDQQIQRRVAKGVLVRILPRLFRHASAPETWMQQLWAAVLWAKGRAVVSHEAAGALWNLDGCPAGRVALLTTEALESPRRDIRIHRASLVSPHHVTKRGGLALTTPTRTVLDLAGVLEEEDLEAVLDCALRRGSTSLLRLDSELARSPGRGQRGRKALVRLLKERSPGYSPTHSVLETRFRRLLKRNGFPAPGQQETVRRRQGLFAVVDFMYPDLGLVIEVDGYAVHSGKQAWQHDRHRQNDLVSAGKRVLRFSWWDVCNEEATIVRTLRSFFSPSLPFSADS